MLWANAAAAEGVAQEALLATCLLVSTVAHEVLKSKKGYVELLQSLAGKVQSKQSECKATTWQLDEWDSSLKALEWKVRLVTDKAG